MGYTRLGFTQRDVDPLHRGDAAQLASCRLMITRRCPQLYGEHGCGSLPCARIESDDEAPWLEELGVQGL